MCARGGGRDNGARGCGIGPESRFSGRDAAFSGDGRI